MEPVEELHGWMFPHPRLWCVLLPWIVPDVANSGIYLCPVADFGKSGSGILIFNTAKLDFVHTNNLWEKENWCENRMHTAALEVIYGHLHSSKKARTKIVV